MQLAASSVRVTSARSSGCGRSRSCPSATALPMVVVGLRADRHPAVDRHDPAAARRGPTVGREPVRARRARRGQAGRAGGAGARPWSCGRSSSGVGSGFISHSALKLRPEFADWDAEVRFSVPGVRVTDPKACQCGEVLKGVIKPWECRVFGTACTPETVRLARAWCRPRAPAPRTSRTGATR